MRTLRLVCLVLPLVAVSCQRVANPPTATRSSKDQSQDKQGTIQVTIDGRKATPSEAKAFEAFGRKLVSDAVHQAINEGLRDLEKKLEFSDVMERKLFGLLVETSSDGDLLSVYLIRPAVETTEPRTIVLSRDGEPLIRFTRATAQVEHPLAIISRTFKKEGHLAQTEMFLVHRDDQWIQYWPSEHHESLK